MAFFNKIHPVARSHNTGSNTGRTEYGNGMHSAIHRPPHIVLGVPSDADPGVVQRAYRKLALRHHPDRDPSPDAADRFRAIHAAYRVLTETRKRQAHGPAPASPPPGPRPRTGAVPVERGPTARDLFLFRALHATGLCFSVALITSVITIIVITDRSQFHLLLALPGFVLLPDSIEGLRR